MKLKAIFGALATALVVGALAFAYSLNDNDPDNVTDEELGAAKDVTDRAEVVTETENV